MQAVAHNDIYMGIVNDGIPLPSMPNIGHMEDIRSTQ